MLSGRGLAGEVRRALYHAVFPIRKEKPLKQVDFHREDVIFIMISAICSSQAHTETEDSSGNLNIKTIAECFSITAAEIQAANYSENMRKR